MELTGKQKRALKALGQRMGDDLRMGHAGMSEGFVGTLDEVLRRKELVKVRFSERRGAERDELAQALCEATGAQCVGVLGRTMLLYRGNEELEAGQRVLG